MKIAITLTAGILLGMVIMHVGGASFGNIAGQTNFAIHHLGGERSSIGSGEGGTSPSAAMRLMQTDTALCDQPYFIEAYQLSVSYFSANEDNLVAADFAEVLFDHARNSGHFSEQEAEDWILHIRAIPGQFVSIYNEDPTVLDSCYNFQVAAVGPP